MQKTALVSVVCLVAVASGAWAAVDVVDLGGKQYLARFRCAAPPTARSVYLAGSFNGWNPQATPMARVGDTEVFACELTLDAGRYEYKFVIDGSDWRTDTDNPHRTVDHQNAILFVGVAPQGAGSDAISGKPIDLATQVAHPPQVVELLERLAAEPAANGAEILSTQLKSTMAMPFMTEKSVTFLWSGTTSLPPELRVFAEGARLGYTLQPVESPADLYVLTLDRGPFPDRWAYVYAITSVDRTRIEPDPHGWSVTTRANQPVTRGVAASPKIGRIDLFPPIAPKSGTLKPRDIYVYLPPGYDASDARYPVLYMQDGQNCWDDPVEPFGHGGWTVNLAADELINAGEVRPFMVVGVANTQDRLREYGPGESILSDEGHDYIRFLIEQVKPAVDARYRTLSEPADTALAGSSMGGAISLQAALLRPDIFGAAACMSPALMFRDAAGKGYLDLINQQGKREIRLYLDSGTAGPQGDGVEATRALVEALRFVGWRDGADLLHYVDEGAVHNERAWRARLHRPLQYLFGK